MRSAAALAWWTAADTPRVWPALGRSPESLDALRHRRLARLLRAAGATPFYAARYRDAGLIPGDPLFAYSPEAALAALRPVTKAELRAAGSSALAGGKVRPTWRWSQSSGSTGEPFRVYYDARAWVTLTYVVKLRARAACGVRPWDRLALLDAIPADGDPGAVSRRGRCARISVLQPGAAVGHALAAFAPDVVYGLPSALLEAGRALGGDARRLGIRALFTSGELLAPPVRESLAETLGARVLDVYGTSETKEIAWECPEGGMHVNSDVVMLEALDGDGRPVAPGVEGNLVVTLLVNPAMPLIRYRTGDRGALHPGRCRCGRALPLLGVVTGRAADTLVLAGGCRVSPYALTCALESVDEILRYQITQLDDTHVRVRVIATQAADRAQVTRRVQGALRSGVAPFLETEVEFVDRLPTGPRAKFRVVQPMMPLPTA
jgi:phenylacetate-CoA ligase